MLRNRAFLSRVTHPMGVDTRWVSTPMRGMVLDTYTVFFNTQRTMG